MIAAQVYYTDEDSYDGLSAQYLTEAELQLQGLADGQSLEENAVSFVATTEQFQAAVFSGSGICFGIRNDQHPIRYASRVVGNQSKLVCRASLFGPADFHPTQW